MRCSLSWLFGVYGRLRRLPSLTVACPLRKGVRTRAFPRARTPQAASVASRARVLGRYQEVRRRHETGESLRAIKKATGLARATVRRSARAESFPERTGQGSQKRGSVGAVFHGPCAGRWRHAPPRPAAPGRRL